MRIAAWNVERLKHRKSLDKILSAIEDAQALMLGALKGGKADDYKRRN